MNARALFDSLPAAAKVLNRHLLDGERIQNPEVRIQEAKGRSQNSEVRSQNSDEPESQISLNRSPLRSQRRTSDVRHRGPNKTEAVYRREVIDRRGDVTAVHYEGLTLRMANGHRYTPDWVVVTGAGWIECHEVKGGYALHSQQRARLAFDQVRVEFPWLVWVWAVRVSGQWTISSDQK